MKRNRLIFGAAMALTLLGGVASQAAGLWPNLPPQATQLGTELIPADTGAAAGNQTVLMSTLQIGGAEPVAPRNMLDDSDFTTAPWQRGTSSVGGNIANTLTYTADRWFAVGGASSSINVSKVANTTVVGFSQSLQFQRTAANSNTAVINLGQVLDSNRSIRLQGQTVTLSFWAVAGANWSPTGGNLGVAIGTGTGTDQSAASFVAQTWTGFSARPISVPTVGTVPVGGGPAGNASGIATLAVLTPATVVPVTSTIQRFQVTTTIPATATQIGVLFSATPVGTAGASDFVQLMGIQLEVSTPAVPFATLFEHRDVAAELAAAQRYFVQINEPPANAVVGMCQATTTSAQICLVNLGVTMRAAPTVTITTGTFKENIANTLTTWVTPGAGTSTANAISLTAANTTTAGQAILLQGGGGSGVIAASADL